MEQVIITILSGILTSIITYLISSIQFKKQRAFLDKEERYRELIIKLQAFYGRTANAQNQKEFFIEYYKSWLYASLLYLKH